MIVNNSSVNFINSLSETKFLALLNNVSSALVAKLTKNEGSLPDVLSLALPPDEEKSLQSSLQCSVVTLQQVVSCVAALILKCGVLGPGETLACCGVTRLPSDALQKTYNTHRPLIDPLLAPLLSPASVIQELRGVAHELSVESCTSTRSRTCAPLALLQLDAAIPAHLPTQAQPKPAHGCDAPQKILLHFYEDELYELHRKLEEIQKKLDSFQ